MSISRQKDSFAFPAVLSVLLCSASLLFSCATPNDDAPATDPARADAAGMGAPTGGEGSGGTIDAPVALDAAGPGGACNFGSHMCKGACVSDTEPATCGSSCDPCPVVKGGVAGCEGGQCVSKCPPGQQACGDACVSDAQPCQPTCAAGTHACNGVCADSTEVATCGARCTSCPTAPPGGEASCDGTNCGFTCTTGKRCGDKCGECCADADCPAQAGKVASCDLATNKCAVACATGTKDCNGTCIATSACCADTDCPMMNGQVGKCDAASHQCAYMCASDTKPCGGSCIPTAGCCDDSQCTGNHACAANACSDSLCKSGFKKCGNDCIANSTCCRADGCCANTDCGTCEKCVSGKCVSQGTSEDVKNECASGTCRTGNCDGHGGCGLTPNGQQSSGCNKGATCNGDSQAVAAQACQGGQCADGKATTCNAAFGCSGGKCKTGCDSGTGLVNGQCVACGKKDQPCCSTGTPCPGPRLICFSPQNKCIDCGGPDQGCCGPQRTNNSDGGYPDQPGQCYENSSCMQSTGTSPGYFCG